VPHQRLRGVPRQAIGVERGERLPQIVEALDMTRRRVLVMPRAVQADAGRFLMAWKSTYSVVLYWFHGKT
jgi:hypothetical protein